MDKSTDVVKAIARLSPTSTSTRAAASARRAAKAPAGCGASWNAWWWARRGIEEIDALVGRHQAGRRPHDLRAGRCGGMADPGPDPAISAPRWSAASARAPKSWRPSRGGEQQTMPMVKIDGVEIEVPAGITILQACETGRRRDPALLLPRAPVDRRQLPHVPGRGEARPAQAAGELRAAGRRQAGDLRPSHADRAEGAQRRDGIPADQPSARLPDLRPGRRVRPAGPGDGLRFRPQPLSREQARRARQGTRACWSRPR